MSDSHQRWATMVGRVSRHQSHIHQAALMHRNGKSAAAIGSVCWAVPPQDADVALVFTDNQKIYACRAVLKLWSPDVLGPTLFDCEVIMDGQGVYQLNMDPDEDYELWKSLLPVLFPQITLKQQAPFQFTDENVWPVTKMADKYGMQRLLELVEDWLVESDDVGDSRFSGAFPENNGRDPRVGRLLSGQHGRRLCAYFWILESDRLGMARLPARCAIVIGNTMRRWTDGGCFRSDIILADSWMERHYPPQQSTWGDLYKLAKAGKIGTL